MLILNLYSVVFWEGDFLTLSWDLSLNFSSFFPIEEKLFYLLFVEERFFRIQFWSWRLSHPAYISWTVFWTKSKTEDTQYTKGEIEHILSRIKICSFWYFDCYTNSLIILHKDSLLCLRNLQSFWLLSVSTWYYTISLRT